MKKIISCLLCVLLLLTVLPLNAFAAAAPAEGVVLNVKDFGAVGDGKTDDEAAIWATFECALMDYMVKKIPVTVYFPEGQYGLRDGGLYVYLPRGAGNLTVKGDGADKSTIVYLDEWTTKGSWVALRIYPKITPESIDQYLHDITIQDLGVYDTDPVKHAWSKDEGDPNTEETHGFNIQHCVRATIKNCKVDSVGDEALDMSHCIDSVMMDNVVLNSPGAGSAGGGISVGDGSKNVVVKNNTIIGTIDAPNKTNWAIAVEALVEPVSDVVIHDNVIRNVAGYGINLGAPNGTIANVTIRDNIITDCRNGGIRFHGTGKTTDTQILNTFIANTDHGVFLDGYDKEGTVIDGCTIEDVSSSAVYIKTFRQRDTTIRNTTVRNAARQAIYNAGVNTVMDRLLVDGVGTSGDSSAGAIVQYPSGGDSAISHSAIFNCRNRRCLQDVGKVTDTWIEQDETPGYVAISGASLIQNCRVNRMVTLKSGCTVDGLTLTATEDLGGDAVALSNLTDCTIANCRITIPSRYGILETGTADRNTITDNVVVGGSGVKTVGAATVADGNRHSTLVTNETFHYYLVDGTATILAPVDTTRSAYVIPVAMEGCPVTAVDPWAFAWCDRLTDVYYDGDKQTLSVGEGNEALLNAVWHGAEPEQPVLPGDADGNGKLNNRDLGLLQRYINDYPVTVDVVAADMDGNGKLNNRDLGLLQRKLNSC